MASPCAARDVSFGDFGMQCTEPGRITVASDRGRPHGDHPPREARRQALDPRLPGPPRHQEAPRGPHGWRQGRRRGVGGRRPPGPRDVRDLRASTRRRRRRPSASRATSCPSRTSSWREEWSDEGEGHAREVRRGPASSSRRASPATSFQTRFKNFTTRLDDTSAIRKARRDLARVKTLLAERASHRRGHAERGNAARSRRSPPSRRRRHLRRRGPRARRRRPPRSSRGQAE